MKHAMWLALMVALPVAGAERIPVRLELLSPSAITVVAGEAYDEPLRLRAVRASDGQPQAGVGVFLSVDIMLCLPLLECELPPHTWYGYWEGAGDADLHQARGAYAVSDGNGFIPVPRLIGGTMPWFYSIGASVDDFETAFVRSNYLERLQVYVNQISPAAKRTRAVPSLGGAYALLLIVGVTVFSRPGRRARSGCASA